MNATAVGYIAIEDIEVDDASWGDLLTKHGSANITYDSIGNPLTIGDYSLTWLGRELQTYTDDYYRTTYTYNADGIRTSKEVYELGIGISYLTEYMISGSCILGEKVYYSNGGDYEEQYTVIYLYDDFSTPIGMKYRTPSYVNDEFDFLFFEKNLQGDIVALYNGSGEKLCSYFYDAWGVTTVSYTSAATSSSMFSVIASNPFRYRGYYYDTETGYYYLQSRYYNPTWGRFLNADSYISTGQGIIGYNMFAYCGNNPVNRIDPTGEIWWIVAVFVLCSGVMSLTSCASSTQHESYDSADEAALAFYKEVYTKSMEEGVEYGTEIYSRTINDKTTYNYNKPRSGDAYGVVVGKKVPNGTEYVAFAHTHPANNSGFSPKDYMLAYKSYVNMYVVGPDGIIYKYDTEKDEYSNLPWILQ